MKPYTHGTGRVNWNAYQMLVVEDSILARADGFTNRGRGHCWGHFVKHSDMVSSFPQLLAAKGLARTSNLTTTLPYFTQAKRVWDIHHDYVEEFVRLIYKKDDALLKDEELQRFWHHLNTIGRHIDPCICDMSTKMFFQKNVWPSFESKRTCAGLMDHVAFRLDDHDKQKRREEWCKETLPHERIKALYSWIETECGESKWCTEVAYSVEHLRPSMGLPELSREAMINTITRFIYEVTAGHELAADNVSTCGRIHGIKRSIFSFFLFQLPFIVDPAYGGVRRLKNYDESKPLLADISTYVYGTVISALTTIRSMPLLSDFSVLLETWVDNEHDWRALGDEERIQRKHYLKKLHLGYKSNLIRNANEFLTEGLKRPPNQWSPFLDPAVQAVSIAV
jgi:Lipoxygenase